MKSKLVTQAMRVLAALPDDQVDGRIGNFGIVGMLTRYRELREQHAPLDRKGKGDNSVAGLQMLLLLSVVGEASLSVLAFHCGYSTATATGVADLMERLRWAERQTSTKDRRVIKMVITEDGLAAVRYLIYNDRNPSDEDQATA